MAPPGATPTIAPSVTAGTAVPWSPTSPDSLVGDSGNPADWPAAQPKPPSLSGAYGKNLMKVIVTLITYQDWVWSHPNPSMVGNYMLFRGTSYKGELASITELAQKGWHSSPAPSEIDWLGVTVAPKVMPLINHKPAVIDGRQMYEPGSVNVVINQKVDVYLNSKGQVVGHTPGVPGRVAFAETLAQGLDGRWRISGIYKLDPPGGLGSLAK
jgi:hypothetical protein